MVLKEQVVPSLVEDYLDDRNDQPGVLRLKYGTTIGAAALRNSRSSMVFERTRAEFAQRHYRAAISHYKFTPLEFGNGHTSFAPVANRRHSGLRHLNPEAKRQDYEIKNRLPPDPPVFARSFAEPRVSLEIELHRRPGSAGSRYLMPQIYPKTRPVSHVEKERRVLHEEIRVLVEGAVIGVRVDNQLRASSSRR